MSCACIFGLIACNQQQLRSNAQKRAEKEREGMGRKWRGREEPRKEGEREGEGGQREEGDGGTERGTE